MADTKAKIVVRFAPSPTGNLHIGSARTALFNYLFAQQSLVSSTNVRQILRIEDTDKERSTKEFEANIHDGLKWLGISFDETFRQSERTEIYKKHLKEIIEKGMAYVSKETPKEEGQRAEVIRFKNPNKKVVFHDLIRGDIEFDTTDLGDFVIAKSFDEPLYHLAVVVDDHEMGVTHIIRGEDHISNTPRQILIQQAIGATEPVYAHLPLILAPDRSKLSKRHGALAVTEYREQGYLPEAIVNFTALLGWNPGTDQEYMTRDEIIKQFRIEKVQKGGAIFNEEKLKWLNKEHLKHEPKEKLEREVLAALQNIKGIKMTDKSREAVGKITPLVIERINTTKEISALFEAGEFIYFFTKPEYETSALMWKDEKDPAKTKTHLAEVKNLLDKISPSDFDQVKVKAALWSYAESVGRGNVLWPLRYSLSGAQKSPDPFTLAEILGKEETLARIDIAIKKLS